MNVKVQGRHFEQQQDGSVKEIVEALRRVIKQVDSISVSDDRDRPIFLNSALVERAEFVYKMRRNRDKIFQDRDLFSDPSWDILLDLYVARSKGKRISTTSACIASAVPSTTALRWLRVLEEKGLIERAGDVDDGRRSYITVTDLGASLVSRVLNSW